jgi:hypothetical protein
MLSLVKDFQMLLGGRESGMAMSRERRRRGGVSVKKRTCT